MLLRTAHVAEPNRIHLQARHLDAESILPALRQLVLLR